MMKKLKFVVLWGSLYCLNFVNVFGQIENPCDYLPDTITSTKLIPKEVSVVVKEAYVGLTAIPAEVEIVSESIEVKEAYHGYRQPIYITVEEQFLVKEAYDFFRIDSAIFEAEIKEIQISPEYTAFVKTKGEVSGREIHAPRGLCAWKKRRIFSKIIDYQYYSLSEPAMSQILEVPAEYVIIRTQKFFDEVGPKLENPITIEARYRELKRVVIVEPAYVEETIIPEKTKNFTVYSEN